MNYKTENIHCEIKDNADQHEVNIMIGMIVSHSERSKASIDNQAKRLDGLYWVRPLGTKQWQVAYFKTTDTGKWWVNHGGTDLCFEEIDERRIERQP